MGMIEVFACLYLLTILLLLEDKERKRKKERKKERKEAYCGNLVVQSFHNLNMQSTNFIYFSDFAYHSSIPCHSLGQTVLVSQTHGPRTKRFLLK